MNARAFERCGCVETRRASCSHNGFFLASFRRMWCSCRMQAAVRYSSLEALVTAVGLQDVTSNRCRAGSR